MVDQQPRSHTVEEAKAEELQRRRPARKAATTTLPATIELDAPAKGGTLLAGTATHADETRSRHARELISDSRRFVRQWEKLSTFSASPAIAAARSTVRVFLIGDGPMPEEVPPPGRRASEDEKHAHTAARELVAAAGLLRSRLVSVSQHADPESIAAMATVKAMIRKID